MLKYNSGSKPEKKSNYKSSSFKNNKLKKTNSNNKSNLRFQPKQKANKKFNPSLFIKKVEEQTISEKYIPENSFADFAIDAKIKENIIAKGYINPTPIQDKVIPVLLEGKDVIATANTGTGKTAAFLIPLIHAIITKKVNSVLIVTPTRELAAQIQEELHSFTVGMNIRSALCIGGVSTKTQVHALASNPKFVIGTPGRLLDLEKNRLLSFFKFNAIVLDEVDTMLDMGFINDIKFIISKLPNNRHSLFFSATIPAELKNIMNSFLTNPVTVSVKTRQTSENVNQDVISIGAQSKIEVLHDLLIKPDFKKVIIFSSMKYATDRLARALKERGFDIAAIHGDKTQAQRKKALALFKESSIQILLATDVVARGIDIDDVTHVINYDLPQTYEDYIHRIGRTGRANKIGQALTFVD